MSISIQEILTQAAGFLLLVFVLKRLFWKPMFQVLDTRRQKIKDQFDSLEAGKKEIEQLKADYQAHLERIEEESRLKIQQAIEEGRRIGREIQETARTESQAMFEKTKENVNLEIAKARITLRREIAGLAVDVSERVLKEKMSDARTQQDKILEIIEELEKSL